MGYHKQYKRNRISDRPSENNEAAITRRRVQQLNDEIKIERTSDSNYYSDKVMKKAHKRHRNH
jgi:hypothetical protein